MAAALTICEHPRHGDIIPADVLATERKTEPVVECLGPRHHHASFYDVHREGDRGVAAATAEDPPTCVGIGAVSSPRPLFGDKTSLLRVPRVLLDPLGCVQPRLL